MLLLRPVEQKKLTSSLTQREAALLGEQMTIRNLEFSSSRFTDACSSAPARSV